jgi:hypothetical protein
MAASAPFVSRGNKCTSLRSLLLTLRPSEPGFLQTRITLGSTSLSIWSVAATKLEDELGTILYLRMDREKDATRLPVQFAPAEIVSRLRVAKALIRSIPVVCVRNWARSLRRAKVLP